jgi:hypothetical protein
MEIRKEQDLKQYSNLKHMDVLLKREITVLLKYKCLQDEILASVNKAGKGSSTFEQLCKQVKKHIGQERRFPPSQTSFCTCSPSFCNA